MQTIEAKAPVVIPMVMEREVVTVQDADEIDTANLMIRLVEARAKDEKEIIELIGRVLVLKSTLATVRKREETVKQSLRFTINQHRAMRRVA